MEYILAVATIIKVWVCQNPHSAPFQNPHSASFPATKREMSESNVSLLVIAERMPSLSEAILGIYIGNNITIATMTHELRF
jgi:hypothetical protein